jgi:hypothetical protein
MPTESMIIKQPEHPLPALATFELSNYRRELEHFLTTLPEYAEVRALIRQRLAEVLTEQADRSRIDRANR